MGETFFREGTPGLLFRAAERRLTSERVPVVAAEELFRMAESSLISAAATGLHAPQFSSPAEPEVAAAAGGAARY